MCVSVHECMHIHLVILPRGNIYETLTYHPVELLDKKAIDSQTKHPAAGHQTHRAPQATLPLHEHKAVRWEGGRRPTADSTDNGKKEHGEARCLAGVKDDNGKFSFVKLCVEKTTI